MGGVMSSVFSHRTLAEIFMIRYLSGRGLTPYTLDLLPGGELKHTDNAAVRRVKFQAALKRQKQIHVILRQIQSGEPTRCMSPFMKKKFEHDEEGNVNTDQNTVKEYKFIRNTQLASLTGLGNLNKLVKSEATWKTGNSEIQVDDGSSEEVLQEFRVRKTLTASQMQPEQLRGSAREKRSRSRPESGQQRKLVAEAQHGQRQSMSVTQVRRESQTPVRQAPSHTHVLVERVGLRSGKQQKKVWPAREAVRNILKDPRSRPTNYFLARFRPTHASDYVEIEYSFNSNTGQEDSFRISSSLENLLVGDPHALALYLSDKSNNNLDEKSHFFQNAPHFFNNLEGRIWWNGFIASFEGAPENRMNLKQLKMDPPTMVFDVSELKRVRATRHHAKLKFGGTTSDSKENIGLEHGDESCDDQNSRELVIRGRTEREAKQLQVSHLPNTTFVHITLPTLSRIPVTSSGAPISGRVPGSEMKLGMAQWQAQAIRTQ